MKKIVVILILMIWVQIINAQNVFNLEIKDKLIYSRFGVEPTYNFAIGYMNCFSIDRVNRKIVGYGEISSPLKAIGIMNYEAKIGGTIDLFKLNKFGMTYSLNFSTGHVQTKNFGSQKYAFINRFLAGLFSTKWHLGFIGDYEKIFASNLKHTQYYRDFIYPEAKDGWYKGAGGNVQLGIEVGVKIKEGFNLIFDFKVPKSEKFNGYNGSPAHTNLTLGYRI